MARHPAACGQPRRRCGTDPVLAQRRGRICGHHSHRHSGRHLRPGHGPGRARLPAAFRPDGGRHRGTGDLEQHLQRIQLYPDRYRPAQRRYSGPVPRHHARCRQPRQRRQANAVLSAHHLQLQQRHPGHHGGRHLRLRHRACCARFPAILRAYRGRSGGQADLEQDLRGVHRHHQRPAGAHRTPGHLPRRASAHRLYGTGGQGSAVLPVSDERLLHGNSRHRL